jgi:hypothetical protein
MKFGLVWLQPRLWVVPASGNRFLICCRRGCDSAALYRDLLGMLVAPNAFFSIYRQRGASALSVTRWALATRG